MKNQKKIIFEVFIILLSVLLSAFLWKYISIPYKETGIIGNYSMNHYNQNNDLLRYLFFIIFPILTFIAVKYFGDKKTIKIFLQNLKKIALPKAQVSSLNFFIDLLSCNELLRLDFLIYYYLGNCIIAHSLVFSFCPFLCFCPEVLGFLPLLLS